MLNSPVINRFSNLQKTLLIASFIPSKNVLIFPVDGGLLKQTYIFLKLVYSEQMQSLQLSLYPYSPLQIKPCLSNSIRPLPFLCLSLLALTSCLLNQLPFFSNY